MPKKSNHVAVSVGTVDIIKDGGVGVLATDTLYGLVGSAFSREAVERIYKLKNRRADKPLIVLIGEKKDLEIFGDVLDRETEKFLDSVWPGPVSVILPAPKAPEHLLCGGQTLAFRLPKKPELRGIIKEVGPLVAPSANPEGLPPARNITEAKKYFGSGVDFYEDSGELVGEPSAIVRFTNGKVEILRQGNLNF